LNRCVANTGLQAAGRRIAMRMFTCRPALPAVSVQAAFNRAR